MTGSLKKLNKYFKKYLGTIILGSLFLVASNFFLVWIPIFIRRTIDEVAALENKTGDYQGLVDVLFSNQAGAILAENALLLVGAVVASGLLLFATRQTLIVTSRKIEFDLRNDIFDKLLELPQRFFSEYKQGEIYVRATEDISKVREYFGPAFMYTINTISRAGFVITMMIIVSPELTFWALLPLPLLSGFAYWISGYINDHSRIIQEQYSNVAGRAQEAFSSIRLIKAYNREVYEQQRFEDESESYRQKKLRLDMVESMFHPALNFLIGISIILVIWKAGQYVIEGTLTVGNIVEYVVYVGYLTWPVASLGYTVNRFQRSMASWNRVDQVLTEKVEISDDHVTDASIEELKGDIEFINVSFKYPGAEAYAIKDVNLKVKAGQNVAIVGRTGSGKSTLVQLIPRLFDPTDGTILIDGSDINKVPVKKLRAEIGFVPQDTFLFSDSIGENIAFGTEEASEEQIHNAAEKAQVRENIMDFDKQFETMLGERGITLSGGQKQRTAIARALIRDPKIIVLDDSLSAVDTKTEEAILQHLRNELEGRTTIMISHRISTIKDADIIYYMEEGTIKEFGTHDELLQKEGRYSAMYKKQLLEKELAEI
ncbi:ABC transporter ATP-binding protein/permease [Aliifodinibius sp. S!AR15-10]|uniref:ABC transporter ATP-binding protein n=1 Tax=Aliifodinibius sp. S!AR15-10 TaxID=2950437 RepID=UPI0028626497|nr:ABC transporter ATP-binding protein [Aliifodinibius sp. S!AR15-10]MDR8394423.1 ABC transporter ATP-binding protein/permease [Aliifodinibius sp. S!AR15-10]